MFYKKNRKALYTLTIVAVTFFATNLLYIIIGGMPITAFGSIMSPISKVSQINYLLQRYYVDPLDQQKLAEGAIRGLTESVGDTYTYYLNKESTENFNTSMRGDYEGVGIVVHLGKDDSILTVTSLIEGGPGQAAGIMPGDKILEISGTPVTGEIYEQAVSMIRGKKGTEVVLTIVRDGWDSPRDITLVRDTVIIKSVQYELKDDIGYIRISQFDQNCSKLFNQALDDLYSKNITGLIIDVRDNPGGLLNEVVEVCDRLLPEGIIVYTEDKDKRREEQYSKPGEITIPLVILANQNSASASEILCGAVQDYNKGVIVGGKTFGKGLVQSHIPLGDGSSLSVTISRYYTPNGISIHQKGIEPDIEVADVGQQMEKAIEILKSEQKTEQ